jgi:hypothetical protein
MTQGQRKYFKISPAFVAIALQRYSSRQQNSQQTSTDEQSQQSHQLDYEIQDEGQGHEPPMEENNIEQEQPQQPPNDQQQLPIISFINNETNKISKCHRELRLLSNPIVPSPFRYCGDQFLPSMVTSDNMERLRLLGSINRANFETLQNDKYIAAEMIERFITLCIVTSKSKKDIQFVEEMFSNFISAYHEPDREKNFTVDKYYTDLFSNNKLTYVTDNLVAKCRRIRWTQESLIVCMLVMHEHWMLCLVDCEQLVVEVYDSLNSSEALLDFWCDALKKVFSEERFTSKEFQERIRAKSGGLSVKRLGGHQTSGSSCGAFVSFYAFFRIRMGLSPESVQNHPDCTPEFMVKTFRRFMELELSYFLNSDDMRDLRPHIQTLVSLPLSFFLHSFLILSPTFSFQCRSLNGTTNSCEISGPLQLNQTMILMMILHLTRIPTLFQPRILWTTHSSLRTIAPPPLPPLLLLLQLSSSRIFPSKFRLTRSLQLFEWPRT